MSEPCKKFESNNNSIQDAGQIIVEHEDFIRGVISSQNPTNISVDDLFQDFYLALIAKPIPEDIRSMKGFLYKAIINHLATSFKRTRLYEKKIKKYKNISKFKDNKNDSTSALIIEEEMDKMFELIKENTPKQKYRAIALRYREGYSIKEVADKMGIQYASVTRYISTGLRKVRQCMSNA